MTPNERLRALFLRRQFERENTARTIRFEQRQQEKNSCPS